MIRHLSLRQINILLYLLKQDGYSTSTALSEEFEISVRTIKNEMAEIRDYLAEHGEEITSLRGKGYALDMSAERKKELIDLLNQSERLNSPMDHKMRAKQILIDLFLSKSPLTSNYFADKFMVSQNTVFNDFLIMEDELNEVGVFLKSNSRGYYLEATEVRLRNLLSITLQAEFTNFDISALLNQLTAEKDEIITQPSIFTNERLSKIYKVIIRHITQDFSQIIEEIDNYAIFSLIIRLCLSIARMQNKQTFATQSKAKVNGNSLQELLNDVYQEFNLQPLAEEFSYVLGQQTFLNKENASEFTQQIIHQVSKKTGIRFESDTRLFQNLYTHFWLRFSKEYIYINEYNPFVQDIKRQQKDLFTEIDKALKAYLPKEINYDDSFVAYVALHFLASIERKKESNRQIQVLYVCSTGVGVASFIQQRISKEIEGIDIVGFASVLNSQRYISTLKPDLVISVFPIENASVPVIEVKALLTSDDLLRIQEQVNLLLNAGLGSIAESKDRTKQEDRDLKDVSRDVIIKGYTVYQELLQLFGNRLKIEHKEGFLLHVLLMVHRIAMNEQYDLSWETSENKLTEAIVQLCQNYELDINRSEIGALMQYISSE